MTLEGSGASTGRLIMGDPSTFVDLKLIEPSVHNVEKNLYLDTVCVDHSSVHRNPDGHVGSAPCRDFEL